MEAIVDNPFFGVVLCLTVFLIGDYLFKKSHKFFLFQPLLVGMVLGIVLLVVIQKISGLSSETIYLAFWQGGSKGQLGANIIFWFLSPATIAFAVPLYKRNDIVKKYWLEILLSLTIGSFIALFAIYYLGKSSGMAQNEIASLLPQAATTAIALPLSISIHGIPAVTAMTVILNAVIIYALGDKMIKLFRLNKNPIGTGLGLGTAGHTIGSAKAVELGSVQGAMGSIAVVIIGVVTNLVLPIFAQWMGMS